MTDANRDLDLVLWGATGFVGRLTAEYLAEHYDSGDLRWALAGRNRNKLEELRRDLGESFGLSGEIPILVGDALDRESLDPIADRADVVCTTVGPYAKYGTDLVDACVEHGTDYCDLTGEVAWIREMSDRYHEDARESGARITHCCGFDSIPSDLGTLLLQTHAREQFGASCDRIRMLVGSVKGGFSGGTLASLSDTLEKASSDDRMRRMLADPYSLNPPGERDGPDESSQQSARFDDELGVWTAPFLMAPINEKIVRRSNALRDYDYGRDFRYGEAIEFDRGIGGAVGAWGTTLGMGAMTGAMAWKPLRHLLQSTVLPDPGEGPSREEIESGGYHIEMYGWGTGEEGEPFQVQAHLSADRDPGYGATAIMLAESGLCYARGEARSVETGGVLTPASGMGIPLVERLREAGLTFEIEHP